jgi:hypothetical protein
VSLDTMNLQTQVIFGMYCACIRSSFRRILQRQEGLRVLPSDIPIVPEGSGSLAYQLQTGKRPRSWRFATGLPVPSSYQLVAPHSKVYSFTGNDARRPRIAQRLPFPTYQKVERLSI